MLYTEYGEGGYDPTKPNNNIVNQYEIADESVDELKQIPQSALDALADKLNGSQANSIAEVKDALKDFVSSIQ